MTKPTTNQNPAWSTALKPGVIRQSCHMRNKIRGSGTGDCLSSEAGCHSRRFHPHDTFTVVTTLNWCSLPKEIVLIE